MRSPFGRDRSCKRPLPPSVPQSGAAGGSSIARPTRPFRLYTLHALRQLCPRVVLHAALGTEGVACADGGLHDGALARGLAAAARALDAEEVIVG